MRPAEYDINNPYLATVKETERITPEDSDEVRHIVLSVPDATFAYVEGQSIGVLTQGPHEFGNPEHLRLYSIASARQGEDKNLSEISICVRRCFYVDPISGERYKGVSSNYLCDARPGDSIQISGPYGRHFLVPRDNTSNLLMIGAGTGMAPFRAFLKHIFEEEGGWKGKVRLFYGARTGMDMLYMNDVKDDIGQYYQEDMFKVFEALSSRPSIDAPAALDRTLKENAADVGELIEDPKTHVYVAGLANVATMLDDAMSEIVGSEDAWRRKKDALLAQERWSEVLYE